ncbi:transposable element Tcb1 transposase [Trichonephila clavipes]|nr:transposable element Tcb1 transposase [Trichonephila clavipes]
MDFWKKVIFSHESKFEIYTPPSIRKIWRKNKTALGPKNVLPTLKRGGGNVMVWGCVAHSGASNLAFIDNKMNALAYIDVLRHNLLDSAMKLSMESTCIFQPDNDPKHTLSYGRLPDSGIAKHRTSTTSNVLRLLEAPRPYTRGEVPFYH